MHTHVAMAPTTNLVVMATTMHSLYAAGGCHEVIVVWSRETSVIANVA